MKKNKILFVTASTKGGGAERMLFNIINSVKDIHTVKLLITSSHQIPNEFKCSINHTNINKTHAISAFPSLLRELHQFRPNYVFTTSSNIGYMFILARMILRAKFKIYIRCAVAPSEIFQNDIRTKVLNQIIKLTYHKADLVISQTEYMRDDLIRSYHIKPDKVKPIRNIIDKDFVINQAGKDIPLEFNTNEYNIVAAGALYSVKGFDILIKAIAPLIKHSNKHLYILGEERYEVGYKNFLNNLICTLGVQKNVHLLGHRDNPYPYLKSANLFIMSSRKEGYPNVVLEALTLRTPVIVSDVVDWSGVVLNNKNGYIFSKSDIDNLQSVLKIAFEKEDWDLSKEIENFDYNELFK